MKRIVVLRKQQKLSQWALAKASQLHPSQISKIESGREIPYPSQLQRIAEVLGVPIEQAESLLEEVDHG